MPIAWQRASSRASGSLWIAGELTGAFWRASSRWKLMAVATIAAGDQDEPGGAADHGDIERAGPHQWNICAEPGW